MSADKTAKFYILWSETPDEITMHEWNHGYLRPYSKTALPSWCHSITFPDSVDEARDIIGRADGTKLAVTIEVVRALGIDKPAADYDHMGG